LQSFEQGEVLNHISSPPRGDLVSSSALGLRQVQILALPDLSRDPRFGKYLIAGVPVSRKSPKDPITTPPGKSPTPSAGSGLVFQIFNLFPHKIRFENVISRRWSRQKEA
jgi:ABC-type histidine transport system ATPase subunit